MPQTIKRIAFLAITLLSFIQNSKGGHIYGAEISYKALDSFVFEVHVIFYRNCIGVSFSNPSTSVTSIDSGISKPMSPSLVSITEVTPTTTNAGCFPQNTYGTGQGIERHIYVDTIDFNDSIYASLKSSCDIRFEASNIRNNLGQFQGGTFYNYASLNLCRAPNNSSPEFHYSPVNFLCCSQPVHINPGARDTFNGDSLSYHFAPPLINRTSTSTYSGGVAYNNPFTVYYPINLSYPYNNPNTTPPIGLYFNSKTGDLVFTPTNCSEVTTYVIEVKEWRKDSSGNYSEIGSIRRDIMSVMNTCPTNEPPYFELERSYTICLGETLCLDIVAYDDPYVPPPPATSADPDTTYISWNRGIPGASFEITNDTGRLSSAQFCWTPTEADVRSRPYYFVVEARDNATPYYSKNQRAVEIKVAYPAEATFTTESLDCGEIGLNAEIDSNFSGTPAYRWRVLDTSGNQLNQDYAYFTSDSTHISRIEIDTLRFKQNGTYIIEGRVNNENNCPVYYYDTVEISGVFHTLLNINDSILCIEDQLNLRARSFNDQPLTYTWFIDGQVTTLSDSNFLYWSEKLGTHHILVEAENAENCTDFDQVTFNVKGIVRDRLQDSIFSCAEDVILKADSGLSKVYWNTLDSSYSFKVSQTGIYSYVGYDGFGCDYFDTSIVTIYSVTPLELKDSIACEDEIDISIANYEEYNWSNGGTTNPVTVSNSGLLKVTVEDVNSCIQIDSAQITLHGKPTLNLRNDTGLCCKSSFINLLTWLDSQDPNAGLWTNPQNPNCIQSGVFLYPNRLCGASTGTQKLFYTYTHPNTGCLFRDSVNVEIYPEPITSLNSGAFCQEEALVDLETELVHTPSTITTELQWSCLDCSGFNFNILLLDQSTDTVPEYWLKIDESSYTVQSFAVDTLTLELLYTSSDGCTTRDTTTIQIGLKPETPILSKQDEFITVTNPYSTVRWYRDGNWLSVVSDTVIDASFPGTFTARNESSIGCLSDESDEIIRTIGIEELEKLGITISPNPSDGSIKLHFSEQVDPEDVQIKIINALGQSIEFESNTETQNISIHWEGSAGNYLLEVKTPSGIYRFMLIKQA